ncbi:SDR family NAD(P)-dependent oxidoreductase [Staphylococcus warneri]|uniref:SDR family NAD(P)-dependent oxidoreductase n=1 Tax=Staphylococcus warneri TaxID=1292 RepID=UPI0037D08FF7
MIGQHYIVTGGTSGLGLDIVHELIKRGTHVTILARNIKKFRQINFGSQSSFVDVIECDLQNRQDIIHITSQIKTPIHGLIYSSGLGYFKSIAMHTTEEMIETYDVNLISFNLLYNTIKPYLVDHAHVIGISSQAAFVTQSHAAHYGASKSAFNQVLNALRLEEPKLHVMSVNTGPIDTPFHQKADPSLSYFNQYRSIMIHSNQLAQHIVEGIIKEKQEINAPTWMHQMLKLYQLAPRFLEKHFSHLFNNKSNH